MPTTPQSQGRAALLEAHEPERAPRSQAARRFSHECGPAQVVAGLEVICGCMFSGKTARLIGLLQAAAAAGRRVLAVKHAIDDRYDASHLATHDGRRFPAASARNAAEVMRLAAGDDAVACREAAVVEPAGRSARRIPFDVIGVDEAHFFGDELTDVCRALVRHGRSVIAVGLHHDAWGRPFAPLPALIELADVVTLLQAPCTGCGAPAEYSQRMTPVTDPLMIGGPEAYQARCAGCFVPLAPPRAGSTRPAAWPVSPSVGLPSGRSHGKNQ